MPATRGKRGSNNACARCTNMHTHGKHQHPHRRRRTARNLPAHRKQLAPASQAPRVIGQLGVLLCHHDDSLG